MCGNTQHEGNGRLRTATRTKDRLADYATICPEIKLNGKFNVRRYNRKLLIKPSSAAVKRLRERLAAETRALRGANAAAVIMKLSPVVRGWAAYCRTVVSSEIFSSLDSYLWKLLWKWGRWRHQNKPGRWVAARYFGKFNRSRDDHWVFGDRDSGAHLVRFSWTHIERHTPVKGTASPDDPALAGYWARRRTRVKPPLDKRTLRLLTRQAGMCPLCGDHLLSAEQPPQSPAQWEQWWLRVTRKAIAASYLACHGMPSPDFLMALFIFDHVNLLLETTHLTARCLAAVVDVPACRLEGRAPAVTQPPGVQLVTRPLG